MKVTSKDIMLGIVPNIVEDIVPTSDVILVIRLTL